MNRYDEHGRVDADEREHGPEWWAADREVACDDCIRAPRHSERCSCDCHEVLDKC